MSRESAEREGRRKRDIVENGGGGPSSYPPNFKFQLPDTCLQSHFENYPLSLLSRLWPSRSVVVAKSTNLSASMVTLVPPSPGQLAAQAPVRNNTWNSLLTLCSPLPERAPSRSLGRARRPVQDQASASRPPKHGSKPAETVVGNRVNASMPLRLVEGQAGRHTIGRGPVAWE